MQPRRIIMVTTLHFGDECKTRSFVVMLVAIASIFIFVGDADAVSCKINFDCVDQYKAHFCVEAVSHGLCYCGAGGENKKPCPDSVTTTTTTTTTTTPKTVEQPKSEKSAKSESYESDITVGGVATGIFTVYLVILPILCCYIVLSVAIVIMLYIYKKGSKDT